MALREYIAGQWVPVGAGFAAAPPLVPTGISQVTSYTGSTLFIQAVPAFYSGADPALSVPYTFWQTSSDGGSTWIGYDSTSGTTFPGPVLQSSLSAPAAGAAAPVVRFRVRTENASGTPSAWYTQTADTVYAAPPTSAISVTESVGSGADVTLTTTYATIPNLSVSVAAGQAVNVDGLVELTADAGTGLDDLYVQLYDTVAAAPIANSERHISFLPAGKRGLVTVEKYVPGIAGGRTLVLQARNGTAARGSVSSAKSLLQALAVTSGTSAGSGNTIVKPPAGTPLKTSGNSLLTNLVFAAPINEGGSSSTIKDWVSGTTAAINAGWGWSLDSLGQTVLANNSAVTEAALFSGITQVTGDSTVLVLYAPSNSGSNTSAYFGQGDTSSFWNMAFDNAGTAIWVTAGTSLTLSYTAQTGNLSILASRGGSTGTVYNLSGGSVASLGSGSISGTQRSGGNNTWHIGGSNPNGQRYLQGSIKGVFIWSRALTAAEISALASDPWQVFQGY